jgi:hypothetical protein
LRIFVLVFLFCANQTFGQGKIYIIGKVDDQANKKGIKGAKISNLNAKAGSITNERGLFFIWAMPGDSVKISAKGYFSKIFYCKTITKDTTFSLGTDPTYVTELDEVEVFGKKTEVMKREIKELLNEAPETGKFEAGDLLTTGTSSGMGGAGISLDAIYDYFSVSGKDRRKAGQLSQQGRYKFYADWRLNGKLVNRLTGLKDKDLENFMSYLKSDNNITTDYILKASDYELNATILTYFQAYKRKNGNIYFEKE